MVGQYQFQREVQGFVVVVEQLPPNLLLQLQEKLLFNKTWKLRVKPKKLTLQRKHIFSASFHQLNTRELITRQNQHQSNNHVRRNQYKDQRIERWQKAENNSWNRKSKRTLKSYNTRGPWSPIKRKMKDIEALWSIKLKDIEVLKSIKQKTL